MRAMGEAGAEGSAQPHAGPPSGTGQDAREVPHGADADLDVLVVAGRRRDAEGALADAGKLEHDELAGPEREVPPVLGVHDPDAVEVLVLREPVDAGDLGLVGVLETFEVGLPKVAVMARDHIMEGKPMVHVTAPPPEHLRSLRAP
jgi:hypothetical protein